MSTYLMESNDETLRLDMKTDADTLKQQAVWAGIKPGMRVADLGYGSGKTTFYLNKLVQPGGKIVGVDISPDRIKYAMTHYAHESIDYVCQNISEPLDMLGKFDFIWVRFVLEYHLQKSFQIVENISKILNPGGILCLIDLDYNCLSHFGLPDRLEKALHQIMTLMQNDFDFDPYVGRKLYSFLYDLAFKDIQVNLAPHHLIYGSLNQTDAFNWTQKVAVAVKQSGFRFENYPGGYDEFFDEFKRSFADPRRFTYTPVISCRGIKP